MRVAIQVVVMAVMYFVGRLIIRRRLDFEPLGQRIVQSHQEEPGSVEQIYGNVAPPSSSALVFGLALLLSLSACVATPVAQHQVQTSLEPTVSIVIGPPTIEYRDVESDAVLQVPAADRDRLAATIWALLEAEMRAKGLSLRRMAADEVRLLQLEGVTGGFFDVVRLRRQGVAPAIQDAQQRMRTLFPDASILAMRCRFYLGPGAFWEPFSGGIRSSSERVLAEGLLVEVGQGRVVWQQAVQLRDSTDVSESSLKGLVQTFLNTIHSTSERKGDQHDKPRGE